MVKENKELLRTIESYCDDCNLHNPSETGIKEPCIFNQVLGYHVCINKILDIMHDILEGTANYTMVNVLEDLIYKQKLFSLEFLNDRLLHFPYGSTETSNKIPPIKKEHILIKRKLEMSSSEMLCFTRYFSLIVGDKIKEKSATWDLYISLRKIIAIVTSPRIVTGHVLQLEILITQFLFLYKSLYGPLKFKFHNMIHLIEMLPSNGPSVHYWAMRFESKHRQHKLTAVTTANKINIIKTICIKSQLRLANMKVSSFLTKINEAFYQTHVKLDERSRKMYFPDSKPEENIVSTEHAHMKGIDYCTDMIFVTEMGDNDLLEFGQIKEVFVNAENIYLLMQPLRCVSFDEHLYAYIVKERNIRILKNASELIDFHPCLLIKKNETLLITTRYVL